MLGSDPVKVKVVERASNRIIENNVEDWGAFLFQRAIAAFNFHFVFKTCLNLCETIKIKKKIVDSNVNRRKSLKKKKVNFYETIFTS